MVTRTFDNKEIPYGRFYGTHVPDLHLLQPFGCRAWVHVPTTASTLESRSIEGTFVGFDDEDKILKYLVYLPEQNRIVRTADCTFIQGEDDTLLEGHRAHHKVPLHDHKPTVKKTVAKDNKTAKARAEATKTKANAIRDKANAELRSAGVNKSGDTPNSQATSTPPDVSSTLCSSEQAITLTKTATPKASKHDSVCLTYEEAALIASDIMAFDVPIPSSHDEAVNDPVWGKHWKKALASEVKSHKEIRSFEVCDLPHGRKPLRTRWVFKVKEGPDGRIEKFKARWVIIGFSQVAGVDYGLTFAPVLRLATIRVLLAFAAATGMHVHQMDVSTAFLYALLEEEVYVRPPPGYEHVVPKGKILKLLRAVYGLKQSPRAWNHTLDLFLRKQANMTRLKSDQCIYVSKDGTLIIAIYVDDLLIISKDMDKINKVKDKLSSRFKMSDLGELSWYLGMRVTRTPDRITLDQQTYTTKILERFDMQNAHSQSTPLAAGADKKLVSSPDDEPTNAPYRELVGSLLYLALTTRPDIAVAVNKLARLVNKPTNTHWKIAKKSPTVPGWNPHPRPGVQGQRQSQTHRLR